MKRFFRLKSVNLFLFRQRRFFITKKAFFYYRKRKKLIFIDLCFAFIAFFQNPYRVCRKFLQKMGEKNPYAYGETPYFSYEKIAREIKLNQDDVWLEIGSGRGKGCFWLKEMVGCEVIALEWVPSFVFFSRLIKRLFRVQKLQFLQQDLSQFKINSRVSVIYCHGLFPKFEIPFHTKLITTSEPMENMEVILSFPLRFGWGTTRVFVQRRRKTYL